MENFLVGVLIVDGLLFALCAGVWLGDKFS